MVHLLGNLLYFFSGEQWGIMHHLIWSCLVPEDVAKEHFRKKKTVNEIMNIRINDPGHILHIYIIMIVTLLRFFHLNVH